MSEPDETGKSRLGDLIESLDEVSRFWWLLGDVSAISVLSLGFARNWLLFESMPWGGYASLVILMLYCANLALGGKRARLNRLILYGVMASLIAITTTTRYDTPPTSASFMVGGAVLYVLFRSWSLVLSGLVGAACLTYAMFYLFNGSYGDGSFSYALFIVIANIMYFAVLMVGMQVYANTRAHSVFDQEQSKLMLRLAQDAAALGRVGFFTIDLGTEVCQVDPITREILSLVGPQDHVVSIRVLAERLTQPGAAAERTRKHLLEYGNHDSEAITIHIDWDQEKHLLYRSHCLQDQNGNVTRHGLLVELDSVTSPVKRGESLSPPQ